MKRPTKQQEQWLREQIERMTPQWKLYRILKQELTLRGHWKLRPRGRPTGFKRSELQRQTPYLEE